jgi:hypothetical protein
VVFAFAITFACALIVFTLPRFVFNTVSGAVLQNRTQDTTKARSRPRPRRCSSNPRHRCRRRRGPWPHG